MVPRCRGGGARVCVCGGGALVGGGGCLCKSRHI